MTLAQVKIKVGREIVRREEVEGERLIVDERGAAYAYVIDELDDMVSDSDDK